MRDIEPFTRRDVLAASLAVGAATALAGCPASSGDGGDSGTGPTLDLGDAVAGELNAAAERDPVYDDRADPYRFDLDEETTVRIRLNASAFDPYVVLTRDGRPVTAADDGGGNFNTSLRRTLEPGAYTAWAGSLSGNGTGPYDLSLSAAPDDTDAPGGGPRPDGPPDSAEPVGLGDTVEGRVTGSSPEDPVYEDPAEPYALSLPVPARVRFEMGSADFDPYVLVTRAGYRVVERDDGGEGHDTRLTVDLAPGTYTVWAGSLSGDGRGEFELSVEWALPSPLSDVFGTE